MSRKSTLDALFGQKPASQLGAPNSAAPGVVPAGEIPAEGAAAPPRPQPERPAPVRTGAVAAMGASLQHWQAAQKASEALQAQLAQAESLIELDPATIDPAPVRDRLTIAVDPTFEALVESIRTNGQQVPVLVRPHPALAGRFQAAYGHRRIAAAGRLGRPVRAMVAPLSDAQLVTAQGQENSERHDLTFIERALFARRLEGAGFDRALIMAALSIHKADLSRALAVAGQMPEAVIAAIGPAPKAGRARWIALAEALAEPKGLARVEAALAAPDFESLDSDQRFQAALTAATAKAGRGRAAGKAGAAPRALVNVGGKPLVLFQPSGRKPALSIDEALAPGFAGYLVAALPGLFQQFRAETGLIRSGHGGLARRLKEGSDPA